MKELSITQSPSDFVGSSMETGFAYLFDETAQILSIQGEKITLTEYLSKREMNAAWQTLADDLEPSGEPDEHDYVIEQDGSSFTLRGKEFTELDDCLMELQESIEEDRRDGKNPIVWFRTRHNNFKVVDLE